MSKQKGKNGSAAAKAAGASKTAAQTAETHVPVEAENFEHTLRRLTVEKQKSRKGNFGLYR